MTIKRGQKKAIVDPLKERNQVSSDAVKLAKNGRIQNVTTEIYRGKPRSHNKKAIKKVNHIASCSPNGYGSYGGVAGSSDTLTSSPSFYDPYFEPSSLVLPRDVREINSWCRYFYKYDPLVATAIDAHAELPLSKIRLHQPKCEDKERALMILEFFEQMIGNDGLDLFNKLLQIAVEYYKLGNVYPYLQMNDDGTKWERLILLDPDYINIQKVPLTSTMVVELIPNDQLKAIISRGEHSSDKDLALLYESIAPEIRDRIRIGKNLFLSTNSNESHVSHIARKMSDYDLLGVSLVERNFKALVYKDRLRQSQDAISARHLTPKHLIWSKDTNDIDINAIREQVDNAMADPDYAIITNFQINWELVGTSQGLMQLSSEWEWLTEELMCGLMINRSFLLGEGAFANGQTVLEVLEQRYAIFRETLEQWVEQHVFKPISKANGFTEKRKTFVKDGDKVVVKEVDVLIYPRIKWNRINLTDDNAHKQMISQLVERGFLDAGTFLEYFGLDPNVVLDRIEKLKDTPLDSNYQDMQRNIQSQIGNILGPAIAKIKADELGLTIEDESSGGGGGGMYASGFGMKKVSGIDDLPITSQNYYNTVVNSLTDKIMKEIHAKNKQAETREERVEERKLQKQKHRQDNILDDLHVEEKNKVFPERKDMKNDTDLFESSNEKSVKYAISEDDIVKKKLPTILTSSEYSPQKKELNL